jgi:hypothetical protein
MVRSVSKPILDISYTHQKTALELLANLSPGWSRGDKTYGYREHVTLGFLGDYTIKTEICVLPFPRGFQNGARRFPQDRQCSGGDDDIRYQLRGPLLSVMVQFLGRDGRLNPRLDWTISEAGNVMLHWNETSIAENASTSFELHLRLVFQPPAHATDQDGRQWRERYLPQLSSVAQD